MKRINRKISNHRRHYTYPTNSTKSMVSVCVPFTLAHNEYPLSPQSATRKVASRVCKRSNEQGETEKVTMT